MDLVALVTLNTIVGKLKDIRAMLSKVEGQIKDAIDELNEINEQLATIDNVITAFKTAQVGFKNKEMDVDLFIERVEAYTAIDMNEYHSLKRRKGILESTLNTLEAEKSTLTATSEQMENQIHL